MDRTEAFKFDMPCAYELITGLDKQLRRQNIGWANGSLAFHIAKRKIFDPAYDVCRIVMEEYNSPRYGETKNTNIENRIIGFLCMRTVNKRAIICMKGLEGDKVQLHNLEGGPFKTIWVSEYGVDQLK